MSMPIEGLNRPVPDQKRNSPSFQEKPLPDNGTKLLPISQEGKIKGRNRWGLILPLAGILGTATALAADPVADYLSTLQSSDNSHQTSYSPPQRDVNKYLGVRTARGDSGAPSVYKIFGPAIYGAPEPSVQLRDPDAITPEECRILKTGYMPGDYDVVIREDTIIRLIAGVVVFPDQQVALNTALTSTYYQDLLSQRLKTTVDFFGRFFPFKFQIEIHQEPLVTPRAFSEIEGRLSYVIGSPEYLEYYRSNNGLPIRRYPEYYEIIRRGGYHNIEYPIYVLMYAPNPTVALQELYERGHASSVFGRGFVRSPGGGVAGGAIFSWYSANSESREGQRSTTEHEILHAIGILEHDPVNQNSVMFKSAAMRDRAVLTRANVAGLCSP